MSSSSNYAAGRCSLIAQPACRQLQESSMVPPASSQYWLQYFAPFPTRHLHAGCSHFLNSSSMRRSPLKTRFSFRFPGSLNFRRMPVRFPPHTKRPAHLPQVSNVFACYQQAWWLAGSVENRLGEHNEVTF